MTQEQYKRANKIGERLEELDRVKKEIEEKTKHRLWYAWKGESDWRLNTLAVHSLVQQLVKRERAVGDGYGLNAGGIYVNRIRRTAGPFGTGSTKTLAKT